LSPGRCTNRENFRRCQRTISFLLLLCFESIKNEGLYLLFSQSSAAGSQAGELELVQASGRRASEDITIAHEMGYFLNLLRVGEAGNDSSSIVNIRGQTLKGEDFNLYYAGWQRTTATGRTLPPAGYTTWPAYRHYSDCPREIWRKRLFCSDSRTTHTRRDPESRLPSIIALYIHSVRLRRCYVAGHSR
jgi:hypothetical protein